MTTLPVLIFDLGNVFAFFDYGRAAENLGAILGISGPEFVRRAEGRGVRALAKRYENGEITSEEFARRCCGLTGLEMSYDAFALAWADIFTLNEPVAELAKLLKGLGHTLVIGSNTNDLHARRFRSQFAEPLEPFDHFVLSFEVGHCKPSAAFYRACARAAGAEPQGCIFIDDVDENVEGARAAGLAGILFRDVCELIADLRFLGVNVSRE